jgi:AcrR family transcriptional regulator
MTKHETIKKRKSQNREVIIEDILSIAREMMKKDGVGALSFNAIARELGIKPPSLYTYFDSKHAIYDMLFRRGFEEFGHVMNDDIDSNTSFPIALSQAIRRYMQFAKDNPDLFQLMFERPIPHFVPSEESLTLSFSVLEQSRETISKLMSDQKINPQMPPDEADDLVITMIHGLTALHMANHPELAVGEGRFGKLIDKAANLIIQAWATEEDK